MSGPADIDFLRATNARHIWHPMADPKIFSGNPPTVLERGEGVYVYDIDGRRYLDCMASLWNVNVGHNRPEVNAAITEQLSRLAYYSSFNGYSNPPSIALSDYLIRRLEPEGMVRVLYSSGGSDAVDTAFKLARQFWKLEGQAERTKILSLKYGYHGLHYGGASANGTPSFRRAYEPLIPGFFQVDSPYLYRNPWTSDPEELGRICAEQLDREIQYQGPDTVAAFIAEPVQGAGGLIVPPDNYWPLVREVCDKHDVLLIADEVITGFGRTGHWFGARGWGVKPDIMTLAKGINSGYVPLGATVVNERIARAWDRDHPLAAIMHGYTYSGHPLACAAALACQKIVEEEDLPGNAARMGEYFLGKLRGLQEKHAVIGDVRGRGLMMALEMVKDRDTREPFGPQDSFGPRLIKAMAARGAIARWLGGKLAFSPPLIITREQVDEAVAIVDDALAEVKP
ncbi:MAG: aminotransferase class III-fold pyridoxal phosphate-dependent enzyme [Ectothiorhodospiraceae bacterium]|nr:aminotransferase class III-fold pyridoxal phosphate-dependent enzyme [Ectothiorhodospiraceae bacterium]MCH8504920.1 aminotransferase class III-fold pyridoxal phosphate-dependent enzyme [Ectothiorhodospiraceae bacterium]